MKNEDILSICISSYNRGEKVELLVKEILKCSSKNISVIVVDDNSDDDTVIRLKTISDQRFSFFQNKKNLGAKQNWYETIQKGTGKYVLQLLDRDWINYQYIEDILDILRENDLGYGYIGNIESKNHKEIFNTDIKSKNYHLFKKGEEALSMWALTSMHPTGFLIKKDCWKLLNDKKKYFYNKKYGIYPHRYIYALLADKFDGILISYKMFDILTYKYKSRFYSNIEKEYWWMPDVIQKELCAAINFLNDEFLYDKRSRQRVLLYRYKEHLVRATKNYQQIAMNFNNAYHYGVDIEYICKNKIYKINSLFVSKFIIFLIKNCSNIVDLNLLIKIIKIGKKNAQEIRKLRF